MQVERTVNVRNTFSCLRDFLFHFLLFLSVGFSIYRIILLLFIYNDLIVF